MEPFWNIGRTCKEHGAKPNPVLASKAVKDPKGLVGKHVKMGFDAPVLGTDCKEHMWVKVGSFKQSEGQLTFSGRLDNDPIYCDMKDGDEVEFTADEIEEVM